MVLISVDTLRADHVGALGYPRPTTPRIDRLASVGVLFEKAIASSSWTRPTHMSIFTGLHPREHGFVSRLDSRPLEDDVPTLASVLRNHGYATAGFHGGLNVADNYGFDRGFDVYRSRGRYFDDNFEDFRDWLDEQDQRRVFVFLHGYDAHMPYVSQTVDREALDLPPDRPAQGHGQTCRGDGVRDIHPWIDEYDASIHRADRAIGRILGELERRGRLARAIVVLVSDHGEEFLEHGACFHISTLHREVLHVPLIVVAPGLAPRRVAATVPASVTVAPTILDLIGIEDHGLPGPSLVAAALGGAAPQAPVVSETERLAGKKGHGYLRSLTTDSDKLIDWIDEERHELYDTATDPGEGRPLDDPSRAARLRRRLATWADDHPPRFPDRRRPRSLARGGDGSSATTGQEQALLEHEAELRAFGYAD